MKESAFAVTVCLCIFGGYGAAAGDKPNVLLIVCDDLNDYIEGLGGHPQAQTPNIERLSKSGVCFTQAHCNIPICAPSRPVSSPDSIRTPRATSGSIGGTRTKCCRTRGRSWITSVPTATTRWARAS